MVIDIRVSHIFAVPCDFVVIFQLNFAIKMGEM